MNKLIKHCTHLFILVSTTAVSLSFPLQAKAEWYIIGYDAQEYPIYMNSKSVFIKGNLRMVEIRDRKIGRAIFVVNCESSDYYIQTNQGRRKGYAVPGTVAGIIADEVCEKYYRR
ncbi:hypothetical protein SD81_009285 [Tolypothrix campylonemoides VB511288]|nr:hypothetical protein SD81_009285 [Tolypothrix campylonemoides VB511288]